MHFFEFSFMIFFIALTVFLYSLPPSALDTEMRSLCSYDEDEEGVQLIAVLLLWFAQQFDSGSNFEILQAYLHRVMSIYSELF